MRKEDMIRIIKAAVAVDKIEKICKMLTDHSMDNPEINEVFVLWEVIRENSNERFQSCSDLDEDSDRYEKFSQIIENESMTAEEKYEMLMSA